MTFEEKQAALRSSTDALRQTLRDMFPLNGPINWRTENSFTQHGVVTSYVDDRIRVLDSDFSFYQTITIADILRAN